IGLDNGLLKEGSRLPLPHQQAFAVDHVHQFVNVTGRETSQEIASGGGIGDPLGTQEVEVGFVITEQFEVIDGSSACQHVVGQIENVVGFKVGHMAFEEMEFGIQGSRQSQPLHQQQKGSQASAAKSFGLVSQIIVDVPLLEHGPALLVPLF